VLFFKLGRFYELFYEDAWLTNQLFDLQLMGRKMHTGFPENRCEKFASLLVEQGYKVAVVEQVETPKQMQERLNNQ
jgi:DNA mismatch repair protein MSH6